MTDDKTTVDELLHALTRDLVDEHEYGMADIEKHFLELDARCKAGDLPTEWQLGKAAGDFMEGMGPTTREFDCITALEAERDRLTAGWDEARSLLAGEMRENAVLKLTGNENAVNCDRHGEPIAYIPANGDCPACALEAERDELNDQIDRAEIICNRETKENTALRNVVDAAREFHRSVGQPLESNVRRFTMVVSGQEWQDFRQALANLKERGA